MPDRQYTAAQALGAGTVLLYVHLVVLEGALRKWVPGTEQPLYFLRDLVIAAVIVILLLVGKSPRSGAIAIYVFAILTYGLLQAVALSLPLSISLVGIRSYLAPVLLITLMLQLRDLDLLLRIARILLCYAPVQLAVSGLQVISSPASSINKSVGSDVGAAFINDGVARASGTFAAPAALFLYLTLALAVSLAFLGAESRRDRRLAVVAVVSTIGAAAISGSRATILVAAILLTLFIFAPGRQRLRVRVLLAGGSATVVGLLIWLFPSVYQSTTARISNAAESEDTLQRVWNQAFGFASYDFSLLGDGMGMRSQAGIALGSPLDWVEIETTKWPAEMGLLGFLCASLILIGAALSLFHALRCKHLGLVGQVHRYALLAFGLVLANGQLTQFPSAQAFAAIALALCLVPLASAPAGREK